MPRRIPRNLGTVLLLAGLALMPLCYLAIGMTLRHEAACIGDPDALARCVAGAVHWRNIAISGFVSALGVSAIGLILDRLRRFA